MKPLAIVKSQPGAEANSRRPDLVATARDAYAERQQVYGAACNKIQALDEALEEAQEATRCSGQRWHDADTVFADDLVRHRLEGRAAPSRDRLDALKAAHEGDQALVDAFIRHRPALVAAAAAAERKMLEAETAVAELEGPECQRAIDELTGQIRELEARREPLRERVGWFLINRKPAITARLEDLRRQGFGG